ncbi:MAG: hypothetical protein ACE5KZ_15725 [Candidatus Scalinduaceae bacterium]
MIKNLKFKRISGFCPLYVDSVGTLWVSRSYEILRSFDHGRSFQKVARFSPRLLQKIGSYFRLTSRLLRAGFFAFNPLDNGNLLGVVKNHIILCNKDESIFRAVFNIQRGSKPLNICVVPDGKIYFGEYFSNPERDGVNIYGSNDGGNTWEPAFTFPKGSIRHIHGIYYDAYRSGCWILTGDEDKECKLLFTSDDFKNIEVVREGGQENRAVGIIPLPDGLVVPMDSPLETNYIQWLDTKTCKLEKTCKIPGSALAVGRAGKYLLVSSGVEHSKVNLNKESQIIISKNGIDWQILYRRKKDIYPYDLFQNGLFKFPDGQNPGTMIYTNGTAVAGDDNYMLSWSGNDIEKNLFT